jgi:secretion/DNA translocation related TadE-like protein
VIVGGVRRGRLSRRAGDGGSATVWVLGIGTVLVLVAVAMALAGAAAVARHRAQAAADLAALAGALRASEGEAAACQRAADVSTRNGARLVDCRLEGLDVVVAVEVAPALLSGVGVAHGAARAGPIGAEGSERGWVRTDS